MTDYYFTRRAFQQLREIEERSERNFGHTQTQKYMNEIYKGFESAANNPHRDERRFDRSNPFFMQPAGVKHFVIYHRFENHIVIGAVFGQEMNIERQLSGLKTRLAHEIEDMHEEIKKRTADQAQTLLSCLILRALRIIRTLTRN